MRLLRAFCSSCDIARGEQRPHSHRETRESVDSALLAIDHADRVSARETGLPKRLHGLRGGPARGDHVLDQAHALALLEGALEPVVGAVALALLPTIRKGSPDAERGRGRERDGAQLGPGEERRVGLDLGDLRRDPLPERCEQLGPASRSGTCRGSSVERRPERSTKSPSRYACSRIAPSSSRSSMPR